MDTEDRPPKRVSLDLDGDGKPDVELTDEEVLARLFPPEVVEIIRELAIKEQDT